MANLGAIVDTTNLTDADWAEIDKGFSKALDELADRDPVQFLDIVTAYFPHAVLEVIKDEHCSKWNSLTRSSTKSTLQTIVRRQAKRESNEL